MRIDGMKAPADCIAACELSGKRHSTLVYEIRRSERYALPENGYRCSVTAISYFSTKQECRILPRQSSICAS